MAEQTGLNLDTKQTRPAESAQQESQTRETGRLTGRGHLSAAFQAIYAGLPATILPPSTLEELAKTVGNSAMEELLTLGDPPLETAVYAPSKETLALEPYPVPAEAASPELCAPPSLSDLAPLSWQGQSPSLLNGDGGVSW